MRMKTEKADIQNQKADIEAVHGDKEKEFLEEVRFPKE